MATRLIEVDQVAFVVLRRLVRGGFALVDKVDTGGGHLFPYLEALADQAMGLLRRQIVGAVGVEQEGNAVGAVPGLLDLATGGRFEGLDQEAGGGVCQ